ncbi:unnamed protein product [Somion occarium]|uniref:PHP domain-like protein n=1 Tax=Somion occarium TaxID=3059160 RepID=A0ABP1DRS7_9APHY
MYIDLNVPVLPIQGQPITQSKKGKGKQPQTQPTSTIAFTPAQVSAIEARIDLLLHLGYTVIAFNQTVQKKIDPKMHVNVLDPLLSQLRKRSGIAYLKRLTIVLDEESEKGFGLTTSSAALVAPYDILALTPTTATTFSLACLTHTQPSNLTTHIISLPLTLPRLPFNLKHTLIRSAIKNGAVFEITYAGALGGEADPSLGVAGTESGSSAKRNWWAAAREVIRVTKGKGIIVSSGAMNQADLRAPRDVGNLLTFLSLAQNLAHDSSTKTPQALILRAQTRKTYRAILSEPKLVIPEHLTQAPSEQDEAVENQQQAETTGLVASALTGQEQPVPTQTEAAKPNTKKRTLEEAQENEERTPASAEKDGAARKRKKKKSKGAAERS